MRTRCLIRPAVALMLVAVAAAAAAQDKGTLEPKPLPPLEHPNAPGTPAKQLFGRVKSPTGGHARVEGFYSRGCLAGAVALPITGPDWQVMRLSRNRNWGTPRLIQFLERLGDNAKKGGWNGLLIGDMGQPRGGPMLSGHALDFWFKPSILHPAPPKVPPKPGPRLTLSKMPAACRAVLTAP